MALLGPAVGLQAWSASELLLSVPRIDLAYCLSFLFCFCFCDLFSLVLLLCSVSVDVCFSSVLLESSACKCSLQLFTYNCTQLHTNRLPSETMWQSG